LLKRALQETLVSFISFTFEETLKHLNDSDMNNLTKVSRPSKEEQKLAMESYGLLADAIDQLQTQTPEIEIEETQDKIKIPLNALKLLAKILRVTSQGKPISIVPVATEMTTQAAADLLGCSRPHLVKLLEEGKIKFTKVGKHRRVKFEDLMAYKKKKKAEQREYLRKIMKADEETGLYDT